MTAVAETARGAAVLSLEDVRKSYGNVHALAGVTLEIRPHEVVGLIGENGAGKSTLLKVLSGSETPDTGAFRVRGQDTRFRSIADAASHGVAMVHQEQSLLPNITVAENILLGHEGETVRGGVYRWGRLREKAQRYLDEVSSTADPSVLTDSLPFAARQMVEVAKALAVGDSSDHEAVILLDEPTSVLETEDIGTLFSVIRRLKAHASVVFVSHRLEEVLEICDRVYVLRDGAVVAEVRPQEADVDSLFRLMVGRDLSSGYFREDLTADPGTHLRLSGRGLSGPGFADVSLDLSAGEIVSIVGLQDSGRENLARCLFGALPFTAGTLRIDGETVQLGSTRAAVRHGIGYLPSERKVDGAVLGMSVADNMTLAHPGLVSRAGVLSRGRIRRTAVEWTDRLGIKVDDPDTPIRNLSGGNQQKVVLAKWLLDPGLKLLVLDTPTRGLDVGAKADVYATIRQLAARGLTVVLLADSLEEGIYLSHRVLTMMDGSITGEFPSDPLARPSRTDLMERLV